MMSPILYGENSLGDGTDGLGYGVLADAISCIVTEELNGIFELHMTYPKSGVLFDEMMINRLIRVDASHLLKGQLFRIEKIETSLSGVARIYASHVSLIIRHIPTNDLTWIAGVTPGFSDVGTAMMAVWRTSHLTPTPITTSSDFTFGSGFRAKARTTTNAKDGLAAFRESWGGDFIFNNYHIHYAAMGRGTDTGEIIAYGKNLIGFTKNENIVDVYAGILPMAIRESDNRRIFGGIERPANSGHSFIDRIKEVDFTDYFRESNIDPTAARLRPLAETYVRERLKTTPNISIEIDFFEDASLNEQGHLIGRLNLGDRLRVFFEESKEEKEARVVRTEWDALMGRYRRLEVGTINQRFRDGIQRIVGGGN